MDIFRKLLFFAFGGVLCLLYVAWQTDYPAVAPSTTQIEQMNDTATSASKPASAEQPQAASKTPESIPESRKIRFKTDTLAGIIDLQGGHLIQLELLQYPQSNRSNNQKPVIFLDRSSERYYVAQTDLITSGDLSQQPSASLYHSDQSVYALSENDDVLPINLYQRANGITIKKQFVLKRGDYQVQVKYHLHNQGEKPWAGKLYAQLKQKNQSSGGSWFSASTDRAAFSTEHKPYEKLPLNKMGVAALPQAVQQGWVSLIEPYFASAWISKIPQTAYYSAHQDDYYTVGMMSPESIVQPQHDAHYEIAFYAGPKIAERLEAAAKHLGLIVDYGMFWWAANILAWLLHQCYRLMGNWGWAIVIVTVLIKLAFYRLSAKSSRHMIDVQRVQPQVDALQKRYGDDWQQFNHAKAILYRREGISQWNGFVSMLIQIPILCALWAVLSDNVELRHASFLWIRDLSTKDPYYILPLLLALVVFIEQKLAPPPKSDNPMHDNIWVPVLMRSVMGYIWPAGLVLYWLVESIFSAIQKWWILGKPNVLDRLLPKPQ